MTWTFKQAATSTTEPASQPPETVGPVDSGAALPDQPPAPVALTGKGNPWIDEPRSENDPRTTLENAITSGDRYAVVQALATLGVNTTDELLSHILEPQGAPIVGLTLNETDANNLVEWLSEIGDLSYQVAPDPNETGVGIRLRVQSCKHLLGADPAPEPAPTPTPPTTMYDSVTASDIPADALVVAGYVDGQYAWSQADWDRFTQAKTKLTITVTGGQIADVCDCETGDLTPDQAAAFVQQYPGTMVYCNLSTAPSVVQAMQAANISPIRLWVADWTGQPHMASVAGADVLATQYANPPASGGHFDLSLVTLELVNTF